MEQFKIGDIVETCSLSPGIIQSIDGDNIEVYSLKYISYKDYKGGTQCSITHCGIRKITYEFALKLLVIEEEKLKEFWYNSNTYEDYDKLIEDEFNKIINNS